MVTTKQKPRVDSQKIKKGKSEYTTMENHKFTKVGTKQRKKKNTGTTKQPESN